MGVRGLQSFLKNNATLSQKIDFCNSSLVIDSSNLKCFLFVQSCLSIESDQWRCDIYGGDMVHYAKCVREFFEILDKCNITPVLVLDGSVIGKQATREQVALKDKTCYQRGLDKFKSAQTTDEDNPSQQTVFLPKVLSYVYNKVIKELGLQSIQCAYEADNQIARIANDLGCPVLTNDSDFIIYPLSQGFIMIDAFDYKKTKGPNMAIPCNIVSQRLLVRAMPNLSIETLPLLSILLGNDYIEAGVFDQLTREICNGPYHGSLVIESFSHRRIANLLTWLRGQTLEDAVRRVIEMTHPSAHDNLRKIIRMLLRNYNILETEDSNKELMAFYPPRMVGSIEIRPAEYLTYLANKQCLSHTALDIAFHNTHYTYSLVDDPSLPSSGIVLLRPYRVAATIMRPYSYETMTTVRREAEKEKHSFHIFERDRGEYKRIVIRPIEHLDSFGSLENLNLYSFMTLDKGLKKNLVMSTFKLNEVEMSLIKDTVSSIFANDYVSESVVCFSLVKYIGLETKMCPRPQFVNSLILTIFYYAALNGNLNPQGVSELEYGKLLLKLRPHSKKTFGTTYNTRPNLFRRICHYLAQLQAAYNGLNLINSLSEQVLDSPSLDRFFNTILIYNLTRLFEIGQLELGSLCDGLPKLLDICESIRAIVNCQE